MRVGVAVLAAALFLPTYEPLLAGIAATVMVAVVAVKFLFRPRNDTFYLRTTLVVSEPDYPLSVEHDRYRRAGRTGETLAFIPPHVRGGCFLHCYLCERDYVEIQFAGSVLGY